MPKTLLCFHLSYSFSKCVHTCLVVVVDFDHSRFEVPNWKVLLDDQDVRLGFLLLELENTVKH